MLPGLSPWYSDAGTLGSRAYLATTIRSAVSPVHLQHLLMFGSAVGILQPRALLKRETELEKLTARSWASSNKNPGNLGKEACPLVCGGGDGMEMETGTGTEMGDAPSLTNKTPASSHAVL